MPQISVIIPVYKVENYIHRCVDSILMQTCTDFELILVDDGSPDNCGTICDEYAKKDPRIHVIHQENRGLSAARNAGIDWAFANSDSQWLSFVDSDDWVHPEYLERLLRAALANDVAISICGYVETNGEEPKIRDVDLVPVLWETENFFVNHNVNAIIACGKLYRKECFNTVRYPVGKIHEDEFTTYKILFRYKQIVATKAPLYMYYKNEEGITGSPWSIKRLVVLDAFREQIDFFRSNEYERAYNYALKKYFLFASSQIENVMQINCENMNQITRRIRNDMRSLFYRNRGLPKYSEEHRNWILAKMFPLTMRTYFVMKRILRFS